MVLLVLLAGCAGQPQRGLEQPWLNDVPQSWQVKGKLRIKTVSQSLTAQFIWQQRQQDFVFKISGPLGQGAMEISGDQSLVTLRGSDGRYAQSASLAELLRGQVGMALSLEQLQRCLWWQQALAAQALSTIAPWQVQASAYQSFAQRNIANRLTLSNRETQVSLIIKQRLLQ